MSLKKIEKLYIQYMMTLCETHTEVIKELDISPRGYRNKRIDLKIDDSFLGKNIESKKDPLACMPNLTPEERDFFESLDQPIMKRTYDKSKKI